MKGATPMQAVLYRGGTVYSERDLFATALLTAGETIAWLGDEEAARPREREAQHVVELGGDLLAPAFVDPIGDPGFPLAPSGRHADAAALRAPQSWPAGAVALVDPVRLLTEGADDLDLGAVSGSGVPLALGSADPSVTPWRTVAAALRLGLSARAAFRAHTRGGWRASTAPDAMIRGVLAPGSPASLTRWRSTELGIQVADAARSSWSVDARAGMVPLPVLPAWDAPVDAGWPEGVPLDAAGPSSI
ncbi:hypothetical protein [Serinibacter salmoneus]|uniref:Amidohydrolase family protein n=1 Tax=Serinibacter salmoneus TaxID=556530 RepID=A0A2A9D1E5_9MICO|nr:hypothetical protein [Serinibacter salmoneus]PFG19670.1 hypothetical protein ATL40_1238 [Serinibacter salmoneus]